MAVVVTQADAAYNDNDHPSQVAEVGELVNQCRMDFDLRLRHAAVVILPSCVAGVLQDQVGASPGGAVCPSGHDPRPPGLVAPASLRYALPLLARDGVEARPRSERPPSGPEGKASLTGR